MRKDAISCQNGPQKKFWSGGIFHDELQNWIVPFLEPTQFETNTSWIALSSHSFLLGSPQYSDDLVYLLGTWITLAVSSVWLFHYVRNSIIVHYLVGHAQYDCFNIRISLLFCLIL